MYTKFIEKQTSGNGTVKYYAGVRSIPSSKFSFIRHFIKFIDYYDVYYVGLYGLQHMLWRSELYTNDRTQFDNEESAIKALNEALEYEDRRNKCKVVSTEIKIIN